MHRKLRSNSVAKRPPAAKPNKKPSNKKSSISPSTVVVRLPVSHLSSPPRPAAPRGQEEDGNHNDVNVIQNGSPHSDGDPVVTQVSATLFPTHTLKFCQ